MTYVRKNALKFGMAIVCAIALTAVVFAITFFRSHGFRHETICYQHGAVVYYYIGYEHHTSKRFVNADSEWVRIEDKKTGELVDRFKGKCYSTYGSINLDNPKFEIHDNIEYLDQ